MKKRNELEVIVISTILFCFAFGAGCSSDKAPFINEGDLTKRIDELCVTRTNENDDPNKAECIINLKDLFEFSWDQMYVFDLAVEDDVISDQIGSPFSSNTSDYSTKWFFLKDGKVVRFEERQVKEIDKPVSNGDVVFEIKDSERKFALFNKESKFKVVKMNVGDGKFKYLKCLTCD
jgi:hypothetical protein